MHFDFGQTVGGKVAHAKNLVVQSVTSGLSGAYRMSAQGASSVKETITNGLCKIHQGMSSIAQMGLEQLANLRLEEQEPSEVAACEESECSVC